MLSYFTPPPSSARLIPVNFNAIEPVELARSLAQDPDIQRKPLYVLIDCQHLTCLRTRGVCHFFSQLLLMRRAGVEVVLDNVNGLLARMLRLCRLDTLFTYVHPAQLLPRKPTRSAA
ncbi:STAS domain-containing protein [Hymenobacter koreensis]|uniref:STAS domain-containing protein n=1 Tax=Hymenobacter koreensis TaxID=1084523 RepID=A0ABP8IW91_9BACT